MSATPQNSVPADITIPLAPEVRLAYRDLYNKIQAALDSTMDLAAIEALNQWQPQVELILDEDDEYRLSQDTAIFTALEKRIRDVNDGLKTLSGQISSIASHFSMAGDIIAAIDKIVTLVPGA